MGKSTQADLWNKYEGCEIINGDRSAITKKDGVWNAYGLPFAGSSRIYKNVKNPIKCVKELIGSLKYSSIISPQYFIT